MKKNFLPLIFFMLSFPLFGNEITGKSLKCELEEKVNLNDIHSLRGYPFYFFFNNLKSVKSYFIQEGKVKFHNLEYEEIKFNIYEIRPVGSINKNNLTMTHTKHGRLYDCSFLHSEKIIKEELRRLVILGRGQ